MCNNPISVRVTFFYVEFLSRLLRCMNAICDTSVLTAGNPSAPKLPCCCTRGHTQAQNPLSVLTAGPDLPRTLPSRCTAGTEMVK